MQNELAKQQSQMQTENMLGLREERSALADQRRAATEGAAKRQAFLSGLGAKMSEGGHKLDRPTLSGMLQFALMNKEGDVAKLATEGLRALDEEDAYKAESERLGTVATDQKFTPVQIQNMLVSSSPRIREQGKALAGMKEPALYSIAPGNTLAGAAGAVYTAPAAPGKSIGSVSPGDFTPASLAKFNVSGNFGDLVPKPVDRALRPEAAVRTQQVTLEDGSLGIVNMDTGVITRSTVGGAPVKGKDATKTGLSEQQAASNIGRLLTAANEIKDITGKDPSAMKPGATEALASSVGMSGTANLARSANRQIVQGAQRDALDALLYLATGAAYNKEQLLGQMEAYIPAFTDTAKTVAAKQTRMANLIQSAKTRAGKAWTPEMDAAMKALMSPSKVTPDAKAMPVPTGVDPALWGAMTPEEQKLWEK